MIPQPCIGGFIPLPGLQVCLTQALSRHARKNIDGKPDVLPADTRVYLFFEDFRIQTASTS
jgi:hypothetical protein